MKGARAVNVLAPGTDQNEDTLAVQWRHYVTIDEYFVHETVLYPSVPGHHDDINQYYALVRLHNGNFAIIARNMNCFYAWDEQTRILEICRTPEQIRDGMRRFDEIKRGLFYGWDHTHDREDDLER